MGRHCLPLLTFLMTPTFFIIISFLFLVPIQSSPMFINNVFIHICHAMCRVVKKYFSWIVSCYCCYWELEPWGGMDAPHVLDELDLHLNSWIIEHNKCPSKGNVAMGILKRLILLQFSKQNTPCFLLNINSLNHSFNHCQCQCCLLKF